MQGVDPSIYSSILLYIIIVGVMNWSHFVQAKRIQASEGILDRLDLSLNGFNLIICVSYLGIDGICRVVVFSLTNIL